MTRHRDPRAMLLCVLGRPDCELGCGQRSGGAHHVLPRDGAGTWPSGDDTAANLVALCGTGTTGCHGKVEAFDEAACRRLFGYLLVERPDVLSYLSGRLGGPEKAAAFLERRYGRAA